MNYYTPPPALHLVQFRLEFPDTPDADGPIVTHATGSSPNRRRSLWHESAVWTDESDLRHEPADWVHHIALTALQDRPNTTERLLFGLTGGLGAQDPLF